MNGEVHSAGKTVQKAKERVAHWGCFCLGEAGKDSHVGLLYSARTPVSYTGAGGEHTQCVLLPVGQTRHFYVWFIKSRRKKKIRKGRDPAGFHSPSWKGMSIIMAPGMSWKYFFSCLLSTCCLLHRPRHRLH